MSPFRIFAVAAFFLAASPLSAQTHVGHDSAREEDFVLGDVIGMAQEELRNGDPEALETCASLVIFIQEMRWRPQDEVARDLEWSQRCARGELSRPAGIPELSKDGAVVYIESTVGQALATVARLRGEVPYDGKKDPANVLVRAQKPELDCWQVADEAEARGDGAVGLVKYCRAMALMIQDSTIKPPKHPFACAYFREAREDFAARDIERSPFRDTIRAALPEIEAQLAGPLCAKKS